MTKPRSAYCSCKLCKPLNWGVKPQALAVLTGLGLSAYEALTGFGTLVALMMWWIKRWHDSNLALYPQEMQKLLEQTSLHEQTED